MISSAWLHFLCCLGTSGLSAAFCVQEVQKPNARGKNLTITERTAASLHRGRTLALASFPEDQIIAAGGVHDRTPDGKYATGESQDCNLFVCSVTNFKVLAAVGFHGPAITKIAFSPDGKVLASGSLDGTIMIWNWKQGVALHTLRAHTGAVSGIAFCTSDGRLLSSGHDGRIVSWNPKRGLGDEKLVVAHKLPVTDMLLTVDGTTLLTAHPDGTIKKTLLGRETEHMQFNIHKESVLCLAASSAGTLCASGGIDGEIHIWNYTTGIKIQTFRVPDHRVLGVLLTDNDARLVAIGNRHDMSGGWFGVIRMWDREAVNVPIGGLQDLTGGFYGICKSRDAKNLITGGGDGRVVMWQIR